MSVLLVMAPETLTKLAKFDTPTICNVIELFNIRPRNQGYMNAAIRCDFPELPPMVGFAATASFRSDAPPQGGDAYGSIGAQLDQFADVPGPPVVVFQDLDDPAVSATFGEVMCSTYQAYGSVGLITSGAGRDMEQVRALKYPVFTGSVICSHAYCHMLHLGLPVRVGGLMVNQGDLLHGDANGCKFELRDEKLCLRIPAGNGPLSIRLWMTDIAPGKASATEHAAALASALPADEPVAELAKLTSGGPPLWPETLTTTATLGDSSQPFAVDVLTHPEQNPWQALTRFSGIDFYPDGNRALVCAWDGDVWLVSGLNDLRTSNPDANQLTWRRIASGLFQPLGIKIVDDEIFVTCRDQLARLHDTNGDDEIDFVSRAPAPSNFVECFNNDHQVTDHFHEFAMGLQVDRDGNFLYAKSARHALKALVPHHGTLLRVSNDGTETEIVANGFRAANGVCLNPDGTFVVTDQEGHWNPKNRINWVTEGGFYGNMYGYHEVTDSSDEAMDQPLCWITNSFDRSPAELLWVPEDTWGPIGGSLLNLSYGYGKIFVVPHEEVDGQKQGGMCMLPIGQLPTGVMRGRFHPVDRQLYACGLVAWATSQRQPGGLYRIRHTGEAAHLPTGLHAKQGKLEIVFSEPLDKAAATDPANYRIKAWDLKRTANYGSKHYNERPWKVTAAEIDASGRKVTLTIPDLTPTWGMEIGCYLKSPDGKPVERVIHNSIYHLGE